MFSCTDQNAKAPFTKPGMTRDVKFANIISLCDVM